MGTAPKIVDQPTKQNDRTKIVYSPGASQYIKNHVFLVFTGHDAYSRPCLTPTGLFFSLGLQLGIFGEMTEMSDYKFESLLKSAFF
jgi:hypothetical protein